MMGCERCGNEAKELLRHRKYGVSMAQRRTYWLCRRCHPRISDDNPSGFPIVSRTRPPTAVVEHERVTSTGEVASDTSTVPDTGDAIEAGYATNDGTAQTMPMTDGGE